MSSGKEIQRKLKYYPEYLKADNIIRYLLNPDDDTIELTDTEKQRYMILKEVHGYRLRYSRKSDIIGIIRRQFEISERQAYNYINECEYVFGSIDGVNKAYERNFLLECSRKNIELAMNSRKSEVITKALTAHYKLCGLDEVVIDLPDFDSLEQHNYIINLPEQYKDVLMQLLSKGSLNLNDLVPTKGITFDIPHTDVSDGAAT